jgi:hypothetical protein
MQTNTTSPDEYIEKSDPEKREYISKLRQVIKENLPS